MTGRAGRGMSRERSQQAVRRLKLQCISPSLGARGGGKVTGGGALPVGSKKVGTLGEDPERQEVV